MSVAAASDGASQTEASVAWLAISGSTLVGLAGLLAAVPKVFIGHVTPFLPMLSFLSFGLLFFGLPASLVFCNIAVYRRGGRRALRCSAITAGLLGGVVLAWLLTTNISHSPPVNFHTNGGITFSYTSTRLKGLLAAAVSLSVPVACALLIRPRRPAV
jgi:hypothetical protein